MSNFLSKRADWSVDSAGPVLGPDVGFAEAYREAYDAQVSGWGVMSLEYGFLQQEQAQLDQVYEMTGQRLAPLGKRPDYYAIAKHYEDGDPLPEHLQQRVKLLDDLSAGAAARGDSFAPRVPTYNDMWQATKTKAQKEEQEAQFLRVREGGWGRFFGELAGGAIGSMNPESDPLNFFTLGAGGVGKSVVGRILTEAGQQGAIEGINQLTGVQENRRLLGLDYGLDLALQQIGMTAVGAGVIRGGVEGVAAGFRRLAPVPQTVRQRADAAIQETPEPRAEAEPEPRATPEQRATEMYEENARFVDETTPYGRTPEGTSRFVDEVEGVYERSNTWEGPASVPAVIEQPRQAIAEPVDIQRIVDETIEFERMNKFRDFAMGVKGRLDEMRGDLPDEVLVAVENAIRANSPAGWDALAETVDRARSAGELSPNAEGLLDDMTIGFNSNVLTGVDELKVRERASELQQEYVDNVAEYRKKPVETLQNWLESAKAPNAIEEGWDRTPIQMRALEDAIAEKSAGMAPPSRVITEPRLDPELPERVTKELDTQDKVLPERLTALQEQRARELPPKPGEEPKPKPTGESKAAPPPEPKPYIELGGKRYPRDTMVKDPDTGNDITLEALIRDFDDDDMVVEASKFCAVRT